MSGQCLLIKLPKSILLLFLVSFMPTSLIAQEIDRDFFEFPEELIPGLTADQRVKLAQTRSFYFPATDERELVKYDLETEGLDHILIRSTMLSGQSGFFNIECRRFERADGSYFWLYSKYGGTRSVFEQHELFGLQRVEGKWEKIDPPGLPVRLDNLLFADRELTGEELASLQSWSSYFDLTNEANDFITYLLFPTGSTQIDTFFREQLTFQWNGERFVMLEK